MSFCAGLNRIAVRLLAAVAAIAAVAPAPASAAPLGEKGGSPLSPPLEELAAPSLASRPPAVQAQRLGVPPSGPGSLVREGERILVTARFDDGVVGAFEELRRAGARVAGASRLTQTATLAVAPEDLQAIAAVPGVRGVWQVREPISYATGPCEGGAAISEGLEQLRVDEARLAFELRGKGITVGVLSDSFDTASGTATDAEGDVRSGDLPGPEGSCVEQQLPVNVLDEADREEGDEGRAMLQIVHDLAPHADLAFATAFESEESFAQNIERLARPVADGGAGADVIVDDVAYFEEPFFQEGPVAVAVDRVTAEGVTYLSAAGNSNLFDSGGNEIASWEAPAFRDSGSCPPAIAVEPLFNGTHCMDFNPAVGIDNTFGIAVAAGQTLRISLQWAEPWNGVATDLDAFLLSGGAIVTESVEDNVGATQRPVEILQLKNGSGSTQVVELAINRFIGTSPRLKFIFMQNGGGVVATEYPQPGGGDVVGPAIFGHAGAASAISVAAVPFNSSSEVEPYSSRGPVTHYYGPVEGPLPAAPLGLPEVVAKPDLAATDCGATTFFASLSVGTWRFCGTSAAAPHAAAVAALLHQAKPSLTTQAVRDALTDTAAPVGAYPPQAAGAGLVDAFEAIGSLPGPIEGGDGPSGVVAPLEPLSPQSPAPQAPSQIVMPAPVAPVPPTPAPAVLAPNTQILRHPPKVVRARIKAPPLVFRFGSDQSGVSFLCKVDRSRFRACSGRFVRRYAPGRHVLKVKAQSPSGQADPTPAVFGFRVRSSP